MHLLRNILLISGATLALQHTAQAQDTLKQETINIISNYQPKLREAAKLGFSIAVVPKANAPKGGRDFEGLTIHAVERIEEALEVVRALA